MTIDGLIERLEEYRDALGGDADVRLMTQQSRPFEARLRRCSGEEINELDDGDDQDVPDDNVVFIVEGEQRAFGSKRAWEVATEAETPDEGVVAGWCPRPDDGSQTIDSVCRENYMITKKSSRTKAKRRKTAGTGVQPRAAPAKRTRHKAADDNGAEKAKRVSALDAAASCWPTPARR